MNNQALPILGAEGRILEGVVTTLNADRSVNISPMGPIVDPLVTRLVLRPYRSSTTYTNLKRTGQGLFHVTDDVELIARSAIGRLEPLPPLVPAEEVEGMMLVDACRWVAFEVESIDDDGDPTQIVAHRVGHGRNRDFFGFNRAKHAVLEAAILATRVAHLPAEQIWTEFERLASSVKKTGGASERRAYALLQDFLTENLPRSDRKESK